MINIVISTPQVNVYLAVENNHASGGTTHYFDWAMFNSYVQSRTGLKVCPERDELHLKEAHFTAQAQCFMILVHLWVTMFHVKFRKN